MTSLNPVFTIEEQMVDALLARPEGQVKSRPEARKRAIEMLERVGIPDATRRIACYPHQFSGGMRQRILISMALLSNPALLVADEPTSALDVTLEAQIVDLIRDMRAELGTAILYITHDLGVVAELCDQVIVMYAGNMIEAGDVYSIFRTPRHPYTKSLLHAYPSECLEVERLVTIRGRVPSLKELPAGCKFAPRCDLAQGICLAQEALPIQIGQQKVLCHAYASGWLGAAPSTMDMGINQAKKEASRRQYLAGKNIYLQIRQLQTHFKEPLNFLDRLLGRRDQVVRAVDGVELQVQEGETLALVGESGCGKTTLGRTILRLEPSTGGQILVQERDITHLSQGQFRPLRAKMQMIFQDPYSSLSPRMKVSTILLEPFRIQNVPVDPKAKVAELLEMVGLSSEQADKYPHQLSGGQARRIGIARALALHPRLLVADEPTAGLDVSVAAGILNLLKDLRQQLDLTYIIITHNLNVISFIADRVAVMYLGKVVELAAAETLFTTPRHPYTQALLSANPVPDPERCHDRQRIHLKGEIPSPRNPPPGCAFHTRCMYTQPDCALQPPQLKSAADNGGMVACHYPLKVN